MTSGMAGHSGYPKFSGRVVRVLGISGFQKWYPKSVGKKKNPKIRVRVRVLPELPEILELHICSIKSNQIHPTIHPVHTSKLTVQTKLTNTSHVQTVTVHTSHITINKHSFEAHKSNHRWKNKSFRVFRVFRVPWPNTRTTRINFGYRGLEPGLGFGFFGLGFFGFGLWVSGFLPSHNAVTRNFETVY